LCCLNFPCTLLAHFTGEPRTQNKEQFIDAFRKIWEKGIGAWNIKNIEAKK